MTKASQDKGNKIGMADYNLIVLCFAFKDDIALWIEFIEDARNSGNYCKNKQSSWSTNIFWKN